jgi:hypothetical protein
MSIACERDRMLRPPGGSLRPRRDLQCDVLFERTTDQCGEIMIERRRRRVRFRTRPRAFSAHLVIPNPSLVQGRLVIRRRVGISLLAFSPERLAGQGTYTVGVTRALVSRGVHDYFVLVPRQYQGLWREVLPPSTSFVTCGPDPDDLVRRVMFEQRRIPDISRRYDIDTVFFPHLVAPTWRVPSAVVTVHDLLLLSERTDFSWYKRLYQR